MKIRSLSAEQRDNFKNAAAAYLGFYQSINPNLSSYSHNMYSRALAYIAVENKLLDYAPKELAVELTKDILTTSDFIKIVGNDSGSNQNIRLSAFRNLVSPFKEDLKNEISTVSYETLLKLLSRKGTHIRKTILESKSQNLKTETELMQNRSWKDLQNIVKNMNVKYNQIVNKFLKTNEIPDYVTLRNILIGNLYMFNIHQKLDIPVHVILRNEYRTAHLWINDKEPPQDKNNYFWINFETNQHFIIIQKSRTTNSATNPDKIRRKFPLSQQIVNMILFIKTTFNEAADKPFFKNQIRETTIHSTEWIRIVNKIFESIAQSVTSTTIRNIYLNEIDWSKLSQEQIDYIRSQLDWSDRVKIDEIHSDNQEQVSF